MATGIARMARTIADHLAPLRAWVFLLQRWVMRELRARYDRTAGGVGWIIGLPLAQLAVLVTVFYHILGIRWPGISSASPVAYGMQVFVGLIVFNAFAETMQRASTAVLAQPNMVTKARFPVIVFPLGAVVIAMLPLLAGLLLLLGLLILRGEAAPLLWLQVLPVLGVLFFYLTGLACWLAALAVYVRDTVHLAPVVVNLGLFLSPVFYPAAALPPRLAWFAQANPLGWVISVMRQAVLEQGWIVGPGLLAHGLLAGVVFVVGVLWFERLRRGFADLM